MLVFNPFMLVSDTICMYLLFPKELGELLPSSQNLLRLQWLDGEAGVASGLASGCRLQEHLNQSRWRGKAQRELRCERKLFISVQGYGKVKSFLIILSANSFDRQRRAGEMEGLTSDSQIIGRF